MQDAGDRPKGEQDRCIVPNRRPINESRGSVRQSEAVMAMVRRSICTVDGPIQLNWTALIVCFFPAGSSTLYHLFPPLFSTFFTLFAGIPQLLLGPGQLIFDMTRHSLVKLAAAVALFLCQTQAAPQAKPKPNALPIVDLGYELYQASSFNVSLKAMLSIS